MILLDREERVFFADSSFLSIFNFPVISGNVKTALSEPYTAVITESMAKKYFGNKNPIGEKNEIMGIRILCSNRSCAGSAAKYTS